MPEPQLPLQVDPVVADLLSPDEQADLREAVRRIRHEHGGGAPDSPYLSGDPPLAQPVDAYVEARVSGLCREGALEVFEDALRAALGTDAAGEESRAG